MKRLDLILYITIGILLTVIITGTIAGLSKGHHPSENLRDADPSPKEITSLNRHNTEKIAAYTDLGQIRSLTKASSEQDSGVVTVITPWLSYPEGDSIFFEELSRKRLIIKGIIQTYFSSHTYDELISLTEPEVKRQLLEQINSQLTLNTISAVYFSEYIFLK